LQGLPADVQMQIFVTMFILFYFTCVDSFTGKLAKKPQPLYQALKYKQLCLKVVDSASWTVGVYRVYQ